ncbi:SDR family NAD(P)-dependent oxidoreductase [Ruania alba]|uniref:NAD(P)-dependent dehydrogenase, short-chain alcohol dehydrogenase family n=1 Tax=Ruania alba TaxID=648782 RepID=A0A1H5MZQ4_9MICO|nr:SDR family NAD(P)-dependent oxidoreductase [Ruania alba]SEE93888.1 NAD(P)-dependent dehydrogenase, short-chain alcohol dehydrogenase family [Ruania alba]
MRGLNDRVALVAGGAHGIGRAICARLAEEGCQVVVADLEADAAERTATEVGGVAVVCDVTDQEQVRAAVGTATDRFGRLDILVPNVGVAAADSLETIDDEGWAAQVEPTLHGAVRCIQEALPALLAAPGGGRIVATSSVNGMAAVGNIPYSAAKAGLINAIGNIAVSHGPRARGTAGASAGWVRANVVAPGTIRTRNWTENGPEQREMLERIPAVYPMGRVGLPEEVAAAVAFLASDDAAWITGVTLPVDGGLLTGPLTHMMQLGWPEPTG